MATSVFATFSVLKNHVSFLKVSRLSPSIDNIIFKLHYRATFLVLLSASILVSSRQYFGEHIKCIADQGLPSKVIDSFCFFTSTFTVVRHMNMTALQAGEIPHPGVGPTTDRDEVRHHAYYQWVPFVLFFQALLFYLPHYIWRSLEGNRLRTLVSGLHLTALALQENGLEIEGKMKIPSRADKERRIREIRLAFMNRLHLNRPWAYYLGVCELLNVINVILQTYLTNRFLGGAFIGLGPNLAVDPPDAPSAALEALFPKVTKCTFHKYGPSGSIQRHDALCIMALNIINEKIYSFLWFWFLGLAFCTIIGLLWRLVTMLLHSRSTYFNRIVFSVACPGRYNPWDVLKVTHEYYFGDWLFLYYIAKNVENYVFKELLQGLAHDLEERRRGAYRAARLMEAVPLAAGDERAYYGLRDVEAATNNVDVPLAKDA